MSEQTEYTYNVFISYSHDDRAWVWNELLPWLEGAGLRVCIDDRDFEIGVPSLINIERAVDRSQHTLIVLTPAWIESQWTEFESLLVSTADPAGRRRKLIPLMLKSCRLPPRIAMLTYADFTQAHDHANQFSRLLGQLQGTVIPIDQLYTRIKQAEANQDWQRVVAACQEIISIAPFYRDVQRLLRKARFHSAMQRARAIWAHYKTGIIILAVLLLMAAGIPVLGNRIVPVWQPTTMTPTSTATVLTDARVIFTITLRNGDKLEVPAGSTLTLTPGEAVLIEAIITVGQSSFPRDLTYEYLAPVGSIPEELVGPRTSYVAPDRPGPDFITVLITDLETDDGILRSINVAIKEKSP